MSGKWYALQTSGGTIEYVDEEELDDVSDWIKKYPEELQIHEQRKSKIVKET